MLENVITPADGIELCKEILELTAELEDNERAEEFVASVNEKVGSMQEWITKNNKVTEKMYISLSNMKAGCEKWLNRN